MIKVQNIHQEDFDRRERAAWIADGDYQILSTQHSQLSAGRESRIDLLAHLDDGTKVVMETKTTDWDAMEDDRVRPNALRHVRQLMRYVNQLVDQGVGVHPALIYRGKPSIERRRREIEEICLDACVEVVWRDDES